MNPTPQCLHCRPNHYVLQSVLKCITLHVYVIPLLVCVREANALKLIISFYYRKHPDITKMSNFTIDKFKIFHIWRGHALPTSHPFHAFDVSIWPKH